MKYLLFLAIGMSLASCARDYKALKPDHVAIRTGIDFEIQEGCKTITKPSVSGCMEWNLGRP